MRISYFTLEYRMHISNGLSVNLSSWELITLLNL